MPASTRDRSSTAWRDAIRHHGDPQLRARLDRLEKTLTTLIAWLSQTANAPIRIDEAQMLLKMLRGEDS